MTAVTFDDLYRMQRTIETWQEELDIRLQDVERKLDDYEKMKKNLMLIDCDHDERINDLENIHAETRLIHLEQKLNDMEWLHTDDVNGGLVSCNVKLPDIDHLEKIIKEISRFQDITHHQYQNNINKRKPYKCPICDGYGIHDNGFKCKSCEGKGIVWG